MSKKISGSKETDKAILNLIENVEPEEGRLHLTTVSSEAPNKGNS